MAQHPGRERGKVDRKAHMLPHGSVCSFSADKGRRIVAGRQIAAGRVFSASGEVVSLCVQWAFAWGSARSDLSQFF